MVIFHIDFGNQYPHIYLHVIHIFHCFATVASLKCFYYSSSCSFSQLGYQDVFILDECSGLVNLPHRFNSNLNVVLILKIYLLSSFSQVFNGMAAFIQVSLATIFYASCPICFGIQLDYSCASQMYCYFHRGYL